MQKYDRQETEQIFCQFSPGGQTDKKTIELLKNVGKDQHGLYEYLRCLQQPGAISIINTSYLFKYLRLLVRISRKFKEKDVLEELSAFIVKVSQQYLPVHITTKKELALIDRFAHLLTRLPMRNCTPESSYIEILLHLAAKKQIDKTIEDMLIQRLQSEFFVDRKARDPKGIKLNSLIGSFIALRFGIFSSLLQKLLIRSENNLETWRQTFESLKNVQGLDQHIPQIIKNLKEHFLAHPEVTIPIINNITCNLKDEKIIEECVLLLESIANNNHDAKKKIIVLQMMEGIAKSASNLKDQNVLDRILITIVKSLGKIIDEQLMNPVYKLIKNVVKCKKIKGKGVHPELLQAIRNEIKGNNKFAQFCAAHIVSQLYSKDDVDLIKPLKDVIKEYQNILKKTEDKMAPNIESYVSAISVLTVLGDTDTSKLETVCYVNRFDFIKTSGQLRNMYTTAMISHLAQQHEYEDSPLALSLFIGLANNSHVPPLDSLKTDAFLRIICQGAYLYATSDIKQIVINEQKIKKIVHTIVKLIQLDEEYEWKPHQLRRLLAVACRYGQKRTLKNKLKPVLSETLQEEIKQIAKNALLITFSKEFSTLTPGYQRMTYALLQMVAQMSQQTSTVHDKEPTISLFPFEEHCALLTDAANYEDVDCLTDLQEQIKEVEKEEKERIDEDNALLIEGGYVVEQPKEQKKQKKPKKAGKKEQLKFLDESQAKLDSLKKHYERMCELNRQLLKFLKIAIRRQQIEVWFCHYYFQNYLRCMKYPDLRMDFLLLTKQIFSRRFRKQSGFLAELFVNVGSETVPTDRVLKKFEEFQAKLLTVDFQMFQVHILDMLELANCRLLSSTDFDANLKVHAVRFYLKLTEDERCVHLLEKIYPYIVEHINLLSNFDQTQNLLRRLVKVISHTNYALMLDDLLNYLEPSKLMVLQSLIEAKNEQFTFTFEDYVKIRILESSSDEELSQQAKKLLTMHQLKMNKEQIASFDLKKFVQRNSNQSSERLSNFARESFEQPENKEIVGSMFERVIQAAKELFDQGFDQEGLEFFPKFLMVNLEWIPMEYMDQIFELLVTRYSANEELATLSKLSLEAGINIIKKYGPANWDKMLKILQSYIKHDKGVANIVFLGVLAPFVKDNKNLAAIQKRVTSMFESDNQLQQKAVSKCLHELMSFFKQPQQLVKKLYETVFTMEGSKQVGQSYLFSGLLRGIGTSQMLSYLNKLLQNVESCKSPQEKKGRLLMLNALLDNFGRVLEPRIVQLMNIIIHLMSDSNESVRDTSRRVAQSIMNKLSAFGVKRLLPFLLGGLERQENWRNKITYIWALGNMANCAPRQLQACLPKIVPKLSACLSDTHAKIRENATEALKVIGQTIKNPEIFDTIDILIAALSDPYSNSKKGLQVLLKTRFSHYIDPPALSVIVPIINYALRGRDTELKTYACQVIGSISVLIEDPNDILPYIEFMQEGLKFTTCDQLSEIRNVAAKSLGKMSSKIGIANTQKYFKFLYDTLQSQTANSVERQGAAQGLSECICSHGMDYFEESLSKIYELLVKAKQQQKEGYISIFIYVPEIMKTDFEPFIKDVTENMTIFVSDEQETIRNSSLQVQKILIYNFGLSHTNMLLQPLLDGIFQENWRKRNGALILLGQMLNVLKNYLYSNTDAQKQANYYQALMGVYILKDDDVEMPKETAFMVWNTYIDNTPRTLKMGLSTLVAMWVRGIKQPASKIALHSITNFSGKYGQTYFGEVLNCFTNYINGSDEDLRSGVYEVLCEFLKRLQQQFLQKFQTLLRQVFQAGIFTPVAETRKSLVKALSIYVEKMHEVDYINEILFPKMQEVEKLSEQQVEFSNLLHLFGDFCSSSSKQMTETILKKLLEKPMTQFKIEVLTNNAAKLSNYMYSVFKERPGTELLKDEIVREIKSGNPDETKLKSLTYCFNEISVNLSENHKGQFIQSLSTDISTYSRNGLEKLTEIEKKLLVAHLEILIFFLNGTPATETGNLQKLLTELTPLVFDRDPSMMNLINQIFSSMFRNPNKQFAANYFKQFVVGIDNILVERKIDGTLPIWEDEESATLYVDIFVNSLIYGGAEVFGDTIAILRLFLKRTPRPILQRCIVRLMGAIIRVSNYRLNQNQRMTLQQFICTIYNSGEFKELDCYKYQMTTLVIRFCSLAANSKEVYTQTADTIETIMSRSKKSNELLLDIAGRIKFVGEQLLVGFYYIVKKVISSQTILQSTHQKLLNHLTILLKENQATLSIRQIYYLSKTCSRLASHLKRPYELYEQMVQGVVCPYSNILQYLHYCYYTSRMPTINDKVTALIKQSAKDKVLYLLKSIKLLNKQVPALREIYSTEKTSEMVSQNILGFEDIDDMLKSL